MGETEIRRELADIKESMAQLQHDLRRIVFCLLGDLDKPDGGGLLASHAAQAKELDAAKAAIADLTKRMAVLEESRKWAMAYAAGMLAVVAFVYFGLSNHAILPKVNLNPTIQNAK